MFQITKSVKYCLSLCLCFNLGIYTTLYLVTSFPNLLGRSSTGTEISLSNSYRSRSSREHDKLPTESLKILSRNQTISRPSPSPSHELKTESEFDVFLNTRTLVLHAVNTINRIVQELETLAGTASKSPCSKWWSNPLDTIRHEISSSTTTETEDHFLEFVAESRWEKVSFQAIVRVRLNQRPYQIEVLNDTLTRTDTLSRYLHGFDKFNCFTDEAKGKKTKSKVSKSRSARLKAFCSCDMSKVKLNAGFDILPQWPVNASFMISDYLNLYDYKGLFQILPPSTRNYCAPRKMLIIITSGAGNFERRQAIRDTFGSRAGLGVDVEMVFGLGRVLNDTVQKLLETEAEIHGDIIQANFIDSYRNLTLKHLSEYAFVHHTCSEADSPGSGSGSYLPPRHILKVDDDFYINVELVLRIAEANLDIELIGHLWCGKWNVPRRHLRYMDKAYIPKYMYMGNNYPGFLSGSSYLIRGDVIPLFLQAAITIPFINLDDVFIGILARTLGIQPRNSKLFDPVHALSKVDAHCELRSRANLQSSVNDTMKAIWDIWNRKKDGDDCKPISSAEIKVEQLSRDRKKDCQFA